MKQNASNDNDQNYFSLEEMEPSLCSAVGNQFGPFGDQDDEQVINFDSEQNKLIFLDLPDFRVRCSCKKLYQRWTASLSEQQQMDNVSAL